MRENELGINACTVSVLCKADFGYPHWFVVSARMGVQPEMVAETIRQYLRAQITMRGLKTDPLDDLFKEMPRWAATPIQPEARVNIFHRDWVKKTARMWEPTVNVFTELTCAQDMLDLREALMAGIHIYETEIGRRITNIAPVQNSPTAPQRPANSPATAEPGEQELDKHFGAKNTAPDIPDVPMEQTEYGMFFGDCTTEAKRYVKAYYGGEVVGFTLRKIARNEVNGKLEYEFYSGFNGGISQFSMGRQKYEYIKDERTQALLESLDYNANRECEGIWRGWFYANVKPGNDGEMKMYLNLNALHVPTGEDSPVDYPDTDWEPAGPDIGDGDNMPLMDDIPF